MLYHAAAICWLYLPRDEFMKLVTSLLALAFALLSWDAIAQNSPGAPGIAILRGACLKLSSANREERCKNEVASVTLDDGSVTFIFSSSNRKIGFRGNGRAVRPLTGGDAILPVFFVMVGNEGSPASGDCRFSDPFSGAVATVECSVQSKFGEIKGMFRSNGQPPMLQR